MGFPCMCCGHLTLPEQSPGSLEICDVCFWQDDMLGFNHPDEVWGPNAVSLNEARESFRRCGASEEKFVAVVRKPLPEELPPR